MAKTLKILLCFIALSIIAPVSHAAENTTPTRFNRKIEIPNRPVTNRLSNNDDYQRVITAKNRVQRGERYHRKNRRDRNRNRGRQSEAAMDDRTQSESRLSNSDHRSQRYNNDGRRGRNSGQGARTESSAPGLNQ